MSKLVHLPELAGMLMPGQFEVTEFVFEIGEAPEIKLELSDKDKMTYHSIKVDKKMHDDYRSNYLRRFGRLVDAEKVTSDEALSVTLDNGVTVGALVIVNAAGHVVDPHTGLPWAADQIARFGLRPPPPEQLSNNTSGKRLVIRSSTS